MNKKSRYKSISETYKFLFMKFTCKKAIRYFLWIVFVQLAYSNSYDRFEDCGGGKIRVTTVVDGYLREYFIHIPMSYDGSQVVPLVFMLHGTSGSGETFYDVPGWTDLSETENFIAVFPSSWHYDIIDNGEAKHITKWNITPDADWTFQPGEHGLDDIKFLRKVILEMKANYNIDARRIYLNGFSNGGGMAAKCAVEMSDVLAAVAENAASFYLDTMYFPKRKLPVLFEVGNADYGPGNTGPEVSLALMDTLLSTPNLSYLGGKHYRIAHNHIHNFDLNENYNRTGDTNSVMIATYQPNHPGPGTGYEFKFIMVKGLTHEYPNGRNHFYNAPKIHWNWMKQFVLEEAGTSAKHTLTVSDGHGGGQYEEGSMVHIWSRQKDGQVFTHWSGDIGFLESPEEYHTTVSMPDKDISVIANYATLQPEMKLTQLTIKGAERNKKIWTYFPDKNKLKAVVWFFHGTDGNATNFTTDIEPRQLINLLMTKDYGIIGLTSEESEYNLDFNGDGYHRWTYGFDSTAVDFGNIRAIRDTLIQRDIMNQGTEQVAVGYSAGGAFTEFVVNVLHWRAAVNHNSSGSPIISTNSFIPYLVSISENDRNPGVGPAGNEEARMNIDNYRSRHACAELHEFKACPLFPERFDRSTYISEQLSKSIFDEIKSNNGLDSNNHLVKLYNELEQLVVSNPSKFPVILSLNSAQRADLENQISVTNAEHNIKADINGMTVKFIEVICGIQTATNENQSIGSSFVIYPNPVSDRITLPVFSKWNIFNLQGKICQKGQSSIIEVNSLDQGFYLLVTEYGRSSFVKY